MSRTASFGEKHALTVVDRFGVWLSHRQIHRWVKRFDGLVVGDFGCGFDAKITRPLLDRVQKAYLADVSLAPDLLAQPKVTPLLGRLPHSLQSAPSDTFDAILCVSVLEHLDDPRGMLRQIHRLLKPGGTALINVPSWRGKFFLELSAFRLGLSPKEEMDDHKIYYDVRDLWPLLVEAGFLPSRIHCMHHKFGLNTFAACMKHENESAPRLATLTGVA
ncbi:MAG: class I SAM-dependent methyltransferase [Deltaproteobacteria bacterium]|nr:class I SAM-dependent methyltransferase [Deltaproteobacteria bacterium]